MDGSQELLSTIHTRWMIHRDHDDVINIGNESFPFPWSKDQLRDRLRCDKTVAKVVEILGGGDPEIAGYVIYQLRKKSIEIIHLAVHPKYRRAGIGRLMLTKIYDGMLKTKRDRIFLYIQETSVATQLWLRACGYRADKVVHDMYCDSKDDAYRFVRRVVQES